VNDVFISAVRFMGGKPSLPRWKYTSERKRTLAARHEDGMAVETVPSLVRLFFDDHGDAEYAGSSQYRPEQLKPLGC